MFTNYSMISEFLFQTSLMKTPLCLVCLLLQVVKPLNHVIEEFPKETYLVILSNFVVISHQLRMVLYTCTVDIGKGLRNRYEGYQWFFGQSFAVRFLKFYLIGTITMFCYVILSSISSLLRLFC